MLEYTVRYQLVNHNFLSDGDWCDSKKVIQMKKIALVTLCSLYSFVSHADIVGVWELDIDKTIQFNTKNSRVTKLWKSLFKCFANNSTLTINSSHYIYVAKDHTCSHDGKKADIKGYKMKFPYRIIFDNSEKSILVANNKEGYDFSEVIYKVSDDVIWTYYFGDAPEYNSHIRNYYKRKK